ncbi:hypothetical protein B0H11DRAFT_2296782 [Mycena galericulata]|nr:hypothetical protein B0H11DRAFT_2296782 [Mycena galericulata]
MANSELWSLSWSGLGAQAGFLRETAPLYCAHDERRIVELVVVVLRGQRATRRNIRHQITLTTSHSVAYNNPNLTAWAAYALPTGRQRAKLRRRPDIDANGEADESACRRVRSARWPQLTRRPPTHRADAFCNTMPIWLDYMAMHTTPLGLACNSPVR